MSEKAKMDKRVLTEMHNFLDKEKLTGQAAIPADLLFITDGAWLKDTAVTDMVKNTHGGWEVALVFTHYKNPLQLIVRYITRCISEPKAKASAFYFRKEAAKDSRGTLNISINDLDVCRN